MQRECDVRVTASVPMRSPISLLRSGPPFGKITLANAASFLPPGTRARSVRTPRPHPVEHINLGAIDYTILIVYFAFVLGIGWALRRFITSSNDFFLSGRSIPTWIAGLAFISANLGAQEVIGMGASGAKYGIMTSHFYWLRSSSASS